ncbi:hypothetical protein FAGAP_8137 [Fusarium agapanthi]|uniref:Uncharacterized protein n=1 Tax=Fusarium agapanthi TaxID=1803897 RepID=A0A9P5B6Z0_9HYPO|nr:hypothetical protein FAGAP_8137 [Fusarium agapanthi]
MQRPKTDQEIQQGWGNLQWRFMNWFNTNTEAIHQYSMSGADYDALSQLVAKAFPEKEHQKAFRVWSDEWLSRHTQRMTYRMKPEEFIDQVMATNLLDAQSTSDLLKTIALYNTPWVPIGRARYGGVELNKKGGQGAVYVVYNDCPLNEEEEEYEEYAGPSEEEITDTEGITANHEPGKLHPGCNQKFKVARIADSMKRLGDLQTKFVFEETTKDKRPIYSTRIATDKVLGQFILHARAPTNIGSPAPRQHPNTESPTRRGVDW